MKYEIIQTSQFKKDYKLAQKQGKDMPLLKSILYKLANDEKLPPEQRDHALSNNFNGYRECHIEPNWLLIYRKSESVLLLTLFRLGSHSELFKK